MKKKILINKKRKGQMNVPIVLVVGMVLFFMLIHIGIMVSKAGDNIKSENIQITSEIKK